MISCVTNTTAVSGVAPARVDELADRLLVREVEREQRLVAQQHLRIADQRLRDAEPLLLAARQQPDRRVGVALARRPTGSPSSTRARLARVTERQPAPVTVETEAHEIAAADRQVAVERVLLRHVADVVTPAPRRATVDLDRRRSTTGVSPSRTRSNVVLPAPFGPSTARNSPGSIVEVEVLEQRARAEAHRRVAQPDDAPSSAVPARASSASSWCCCHA